MVRFESLMAGMYLMTTMWSRCSPFFAFPPLVTAGEGSAGLKSNALLATMSSTTLLLPISLILNCASADKLQPSLFPRWL